MDILLVILDSLSRQMHLALIRIKAPSDGVSKEISEIEKIDLEMDAALVEHLELFNDDKLHYFQTTMKASLANRSAPPAKSHQFIGVNLAIVVSEFSGLKSMARISVSNQAIRLACQILHFLRTELEESPIEQDAGAPLKTHRILALINATVRLATRDVKAADLRDWGLLVGEFLSDRMRFEAWIQKNHPQPFRRKSRSLLDQTVDGISRIIRSWVVNPQLPDPSSSDNLLVVTERDAPTTLQEVSLTEVAEIQDVSRSTEPRPDDPVPVRWEGPLVDPEWVSEKLREHGREITAQTLKNGYWKKWKPHDHKKGSAFFFYWDRIMPIVEEQFDIQFND